MSIKSRVLSERESAFSLSMTRVEETENLAREYRERADLAKRAIKARKSLIATLKSINENTMLYRMIQEAIESIENEIGYILNSK